MNALTDLSAAVAPPLACRLLALAAPADADADPAPQARWLAALGPPEPLAAMLDAWRQDPPPEDARLHRLARALALNLTEMTAVALALTADTDLMAGRAIAWLQAPLADTQPTLGLVASLQAHRGIGNAAALAELLDGAALASGLLALHAGGRCLPDALLRIRSRWWRRWPGAKAAGRAST